MNNTTNTTLETLEKEYMKLHDTRVNYGTAYQITDLNEADTTYLKIYLHEVIAYKEFKKAQIPEASFNRVHKPVIDYRINSLSERLRNKGVKVVI